MRDYCKVSPAWWATIGRHLRGDTTAIAVARYIEECPSSNMIGLYYLPSSLMMHELGVPWLPKPLTDPLHEGCDDRLTPSQGCLAGALDTLAELGVAFFSSEADLVWIPEFAAFNVEVTLSAKDNRRKPVLQQLAAAGDHAFSRAFMHRYGEAYHLIGAPGVPPSEGMPKGAYVPLLKRSTAPLAKSGAGTGARTGSGADARSSPSLSDTPPLKLEAPEAPSKGDAPPKRSAIDYGTAYAAGIERATGLAQRPRLRGDEIAILRGIVVTHAKAEGGSPLRGDELRAWIERSAHDYAKACPNPDFEQGWSLKKFAEWWDRGCRADSDRAPRGANGGAGVQQRWGSDRSWSIGRGEAVDGSDPRRD